MAGCLPYIRMQEVIFEELEEAISCMVCLEVPKQVTVQCMVGHHVCTACREQLTNCPMCRSHFGTTRNFAMEKVAEILCKRRALLTGLELDSDGLHHSSTQTDDDWLTNLLTEMTEVSERGNAANAGARKESNGAANDHRCRRCEVQKEEERNGGGAPSAKTNDAARNGRTNDESAETKEEFRGCRCSIRTCTLFLRTRELVEHVRNAHADTYNKFYISGTSFSKSFIVDYGAARDYSYALHAINLGLFFLNIRVDDKGNLSMVIQMADTVEKCKKLVSMFGVNSHSRTLKKYGKVWSCKIPREKLLPNVYLRILGQELSNFHNPASVVTCYVGVHLRANKD